MDIHQFDEQIPLARNIDRVAGNLAVLKEDMEGIYFSDVTSICPAEVQEAIQLLDNILSLRRRLDTVLGRKEIKDAHISTEEFSDAYLGR